MVKKIIFLLFISQSLYAGVWTYDIDGTIDFKTSSLRNTTYNTIILRVSSESVGGVWKQDFAAYSGTGTATAAFYRVNISLNYTVNGISERDKLDTTINNTISNTNVKACNIEIFNGYCKRAQEADIPIVPVKSYIK